MTADRPNVFRAATAMRRGLLSIGLTFAFLIADTPAGAQAAAAQLGDSSIDLDLYARLLERHTRTTHDIVGVRVDYEAIQKDPEWQDLVSQVRRAKPKALDRDARMAFWINAYNILTIDLVRANYPIDSIKSIGSFFSPVWDKEVARIEGKSLSLGQIEHEILRPMGDPRIHAAIVCASISCPALSRTPFRPASLDADLSAAMRAWLASDEKGLRVNHSAKAIRISKIFDWFEEDFEKTGGVLATITRYAPTEETAFLKAEGDSLEVSYFPYDWSLNAAR